MKERPIIFSGEMVRAILDGRKTQTRRVIKPQPRVAGGQIKFPWATFYGNGLVHTWDEDGVGGENWQANDYPNENRFTQALKRTPYPNPCPLGAPGDRFWVRETWGESGLNRIEYKAFPADGTDFRCVSRWRPSIHMHRSVSRLTLEITNVGVERLQDVSNGDGQAEGVEGWPLPQGTTDYVMGFKQIWDSLQTKPGKRWEDNPWVWVIEFKRVTE